MCAQKRLWQLYHHTLLWATASVVHVLVLIDIVVVLFGTDFMEMCTSPERLWVFGECANPRVEIEELV